MPYPDPIDFIRKMEEVLRTAPTKQDLNGSYIEVRSMTVTNWCAFLREMIAASEKQDSQ